MWSFIHGLGFPNHLSQDPARFHTSVVEHPHLKAGWKNLCLQTEESNHHLKRARIAKKPSWDAKNIWGKSQSPFCYMHLALALEPASPEICPSKATALKWRCIHWRWANAGGPDGQCSWEVHVASGWVWVWDGSCKTTWMTWDGWKVPTSTSASSTESSWQADRVGHGWWKWKFAQAAVI